MIFGSENVCRVIAGHSVTPLRVAWPSDLGEAMLMNAQGLVWQGMAAQVQLLMMDEYGKATSDDMYAAKTRAGLEGSLRWLDSHAADITSALPPDQSISILEAGLFCLLEHLGFSHTESLESYPSSHSPVAARQRRRNLRRCSELSVSWR